MIKTAFAAAAATAFAAPGAALAGPYVNVETNAGWTGAEYTGAATDFHETRGCSWRICFLLRPGRRYPGLP